MQSQKSILQLPAAGMDNFSQISSEVSYTFRKPINKSSIGFQELFCDCTSFFKGGVKSHIFYIGHGPWSKKFETPSVVMKVQISYYRT